MAKNKKLEYQNRKPDLETESIKAWVADKNEFNEAEKTAKEEEHKIIIKTKNGFEMRLMGFTKMINEKAGKILFAYKFKEEFKNIIYYIPEDLEEKDKPKIDIFLNKIKEVAKIGGYEMVDAKEFAERASDEGKRIAKYHAKKDERKEDL